MHLEQASFMDSCTWFVYCNLITDYDYHILRQQNVIPKAEDAKRNKPKVFLDRN